MVALESASSTELVDVERRVVAVVAGGVQKHRQQHRFLLVVRAAAMAIGDCRYDVYRFIPEMYRYRQH